MGCIISVPANPEMSKGPPDSTKSIPVASYIQMMQPGTPAPTDALFTLTLKGDKINASFPVGEQVTPSDAILAAFSSKPSNMNGIVYSVLQENAAEVLKVSGKSYPSDCKAVFISRGVVTLDPPNFNGILTEEGAKEKYAQVFGSKDGVVVKHFTTAAAGYEPNIGGGVYFFTASEKIDTYLGSEFWAELSTNLPWKDVKFEKYTVVS